MWLEGNPLTPEAVAALLEALPTSQVSALGLDEAQLSELPLAQREPLVAAAGRKLRVCRIVGGTAGPGPGYFKLEPAPAAAAAASNGSSRPTTEVGGAGVLSWMVLRLRRRVGLVPAAVLASVSGSCMPRLHRPPLPPLLPAAGAGRVLWVGPRHAQLGRAAEKGAGRGQGVE